RAQDRLGMLPADVLQGAPAVRDVDYFVTDVAEVTRAVPGKKIEHLLRFGVTNERRGRGVGCGLIPAIERRSEGAGGLVCARNGGFVHGAQGPVAFADIPRL